MQNNRKNEISQQKQWRQQYKVLARKVDEGEKSYIKSLATFGDLNPQLSSMCHGVMSDHEATQKKGEKQRNNVFTKLNKIKESINELQQTLKFFDKTNQSLLKVQKLSEGIFNKMQIMKNQMANSYDQLDDIERKLSSDLQLIDRRVQSFDTQEQHQLFEPVAKKARNKQNSSVDNNQVKASKNKIKSEKNQQVVIQSKIEQIEKRMRNKQKQVEAVEEEIHSLGKFLGWHQEDHKDFITIWNRNQLTKNYFQIQDQLTQYFKMYTAQQIIQHMNNYMKLKKLNQKKKVLINEYKDLKQLKKNEQIIKLKSNQQQKLKKIRQEQQLKKMDIQQKQMKQKVQNWKKQKQLQKIEQKKKIEQQNQRKKQSQINRRKIQQSRRRQILQQWKVEKQQKQKQVKQSQKRPHSAINKQTRDRIRQRQQQLIREKMEKAIQKKMRQQQLQKKAQKIRDQKFIKYAHVKPKLQQKTTAVKQKQRQKYDGKQKKDACTFGGQLLLTGVRAIPEWRQGL